MSEKKSPEQEGGCTNCGQCEKWREDFPTEWAQDNYITRRDFTRFLIFTSGATLLGNGFFILKNALRLAEPAVPPLRVAATDEIPVGGVKLFRYPTADDPAMLIRLEEDAFVAFRQRCTHLSGPVIFNPKTRRLDCPCHNGVFDAETGHVLEGPPPHPLPQIALAFRDGAIWAEGVIATATEVESERDGRKRRGGEARRA